MIDRKSRDLLAQALRQYVSGRITNDELYEVELHPGDRGAWAVYQRAWYLYDDMSVHKATGIHYVYDDIRNEISRWILFLYSDEEYLWPEYSFVRFWTWPLTIVTLGLWRHYENRKWARFLASGDYNVWPFIRKEDLKRAKENPRLLAGKQSEV